jgi:hypothetical protein
MTWTCRCITVCPAAAPTLTPTLKPCAWPSAPSRSAASRSAAQISAISSPVAWKRSATCRLGMMRARPGETGKASRTVGVSRVSAAMRSRGMRYAAEGAVLLAHAGSGVGPYPVLAGGVPHETVALVSGLSAAIDSIRPTQAEHSFRSDLISDESHPGRDRTKPPQRRRVGCGEGRTAPCHRRRQTRCGSCVTAPYRLAPEDGKTTSS